MKTTTPFKKNKSKKPGKTSNKTSRKHTSKECCAPIKDLPESSTGKKPKATPPMMKKVPTRKDETGGSFTVVAIIVSK